MKIHVVKKGETVLSIARQYGVSPGLLQRQNQVPPDGALVPGQTLVVQEAEKKMYADKAAFYASRKLKTRTEFDSHAQ